MSQALIAKRFSRSLEESPHYPPDWRHQQAWEYRTQTERAQTLPGYHFNFPVDEDDEIVVNYYLFLRCGRCNSDEQAIRYAYDCFTHNISYGMGSRIKAMIVAGLSVKQIAKKFRTKERNIEVFAKLFWDVLDVLDCPDYITHLVLPFSINNPDDIALSRERLWLITAYLTGWRGLENVMYRKVDLSKEDIADMDRLILNCLKTTAFEYIVGVKANPLARPVDFERLILYRQIEQQLETENGLQSWGTDLFSVIANKVAALPATHPLSELNRSSEKTIRKLQDTAPPTTKFKSKIIDLDVSLSCQKPLKTGKSLNPLD